MTSQDPNPCILTDESGRILLSNPAARQEFSLPDVADMTVLLESFFADAGKVFSSLTKDATLLGIAETDITRAAGRQRLRVQRQQEHHLLWRFEAIVTAEEASDFFALPLIRVTENGEIKYLNQFARRLLQGQPQRTDQFLQGPMRPGIARFIVNGKALSVVLSVRQHRQGTRDFLVHEIPDAQLQPSDSLDFFEKLPVAVLKINAGGEVEVANRLARDLLMLPPGRVQFADTVEGLGRPVQEWVSDVITASHGASSEVLRARRGDRELYLQVSLCRGQNSDGPAAIAVLNDATELKRMEAQFNQSQKMQAIGELAGGVAHDFNNLLTAISGHCDLLLLRRDEGHPDYGDLIQIHQNANRAAALVEQLLAFSRKQTLRPQLVDLRDTLQDLTHLLDRLVGARIRLSVHHDSGLSPIWVDRRQFEQVVMNLVVNARDAMPDGGEIQISTSVRKLVRNLHRDRAIVPAGEYVVISVEDQGTGIPQDKIAKIFDPFFTTKAPGKGTGLGLSMVYGIVKQSGAFIFVDSTSSRGTRFVLYFPRRKSGPDVESVTDTSSLSHRGLQDGGEIAMAASLNLVEARNAQTAVATESASMPTKPATNLRGLSNGAGVVLLVEDEAPVRAFAAKALALRGYTVLEADSAEMALETLARCATPVDLFISDVVMPGEDGPTWVRKARLEYPETPVIFMSGYAEEVFSKNREEIPGSVFLPKPFSLTELTQTVKEQISNRALDEVHDLTD